MFPRTSHNRSVLLSAAILLLVACGGGGEEGAATGGSTTSPGTGSGTGSAGGGTSSGGSSGDSTAAGSATLSWMPPEENTDGSSVTSLAGYHVYRGNSRETLALVRTITNPGITTIVFDGMTAGTHYFAVSAYLISGVESDPSAVGSKTIP